MKAGENRCNQKVGFVPGNQKGYCKNVAVYKEEKEGGKMAYFCAECYHRLKGDHTPSSVQEKP